MLGSDCSRLTLAVAAFFKVLELVQLLLLLLLDRLSLLTLLGLPQELAVVVLDHNDQLL